MRRSAAVVAAIALGLTVYLTTSTVPGGDIGGGSGGARPQQAAATPASPAESYRAVRERGAPAAVVREPTALRARPSAHAERVATLAKRTEFDSARVLAVTGRRGHWLRVLASELPNGERGWVHWSAVRLVPTPWRITADLSERTVTVRRAGRVLRRFPVAVGAAGTPTPTGRFAVTDKIRFTDGHAAYGCCAIALSGHQPNVAQGWTGGDRIAIHGTSAPASIGTPASHGCLRAREEDLRWMLRHVLLGTVVEIRD
jgi:lipoprotein-anchoring transpeptidase ErfK/SrfK